MFKVDARECLAIEDPRIEVCIPACLVQLNYDSLHRAMVLELQQSGRQQGRKQTQRELLLKPTSTSLSVSCAACLNSALRSTDTVVGDGTHLCGRKHFRGALSTVDNML